MLNCFQNESIVSSVTVLKMCHSIEGVSELRKFTKIVILSAAKNLFAIM